MLLKGFLITTLLYNVAGETCHYQRCVGCQPEELSNVGTTIQCHPENWVSAEWIHKLGHPPPNTASIIPIEYRCLKMVATPDNKSLGNTVDILRGCVPASSVDSICFALIAVERARGHSDARCFTCRGNNCNSAYPTSRSQLIVTIAILGYLVLR